jgi:acetyl-CoA carboxylase biotin carboxyl carrier protein
MDLTQEEILKILDLIEKSNFDYMELQVGELKLTVGKGNYVPGSAPAPESKMAASAKPAAAAKQTEEKTRARAPKTTAKINGGLGIPAPMVGTFYAAPEPGAAPFVKLGSMIDEETTVGLIEVMKVFNAVQSRVRGTIADVCVQNGEFVEYGQTLFVVKPGGGKKQSTLPQAQRGSSAQARSKPKPGRTR